MSAILPRFGASDQSAPVGDPATFGRSGLRRRLSADYYQTNPISRASETMAECTKCLYAGPGDGG